MKEKDMLALYCARGIINEVITLVLTEHPTILAKAVCNFFANYPEIVARASDIAKDIQRLAKEQGVGKQ